MTPCKAMLAALDGDSAQLLRELADECMDREPPDYVENAGWLWLAESRRRPVWHRSDWWGWKAESSGFSWELPGVIFDRLHAGVPRGTWRRFDSLSEAMQTAAIAAGEALEVQATMERVARERAAEIEKRKDCTLCNGTGRVEFSTGMVEPCPLHGKR